MPLRHTENKENKKPSKRIRLFPVTASLTVPKHIPRPPYVLGRSLPSTMGLVVPKTDEEIRLMRGACQLASKIRQFAGSLVKPGVTTDYIDKMVHQEIIKHNAYPSPLGYSGFPKSLCSSINDVVVHGIPDLRVLEDGDIVNLDVSVYMNGFHGDCNATFLCGNVDEKGRALVHHTKMAMLEGIRICKPGAPFNAIGAAISDYAERYGYSVVENYSGHGIGRDFHIPPLIYHFRNDEEGIMEPNITFTIEPMLNEGGPDNFVLEDGWTVVTKDGRRSAQFEETVLITKTGVEILTKHE